jgi:hypothetical protein
MTSASIAYSNSNDVEHGMSVPISLNVFIIDIKKSIEAQTNKDRIIGDYKLKIDLTFVKKSNNSEKIINKAIQFKITKGSQSTSEKKEETKISTEYILAMSNPSSDKGKKLNGKITFKESENGGAIAIGTMQGFEDGGVIGPIDGKPGLKASDGLANEMVILLENAISTKYNATIKLVILSKK